MKQKKSKVLQEYTKNRSSIRTQSMMLCVKWQINVKFSSVFEFVRYLKRRYVNNAVLVC